MVKAIGFPGRYLQGPDAIMQLLGLLLELGCTRPIVLVDSAIRQAVWEPIAARLGAGQSGLSVLEFPGECTAAIVQSLAQQARLAQADCIVGFGGGKTIDTAKGIARECDARLVIAPTIASNDSPTSRLIVLYDEHHKVSAVQMMKRNPDAVVVDTAIVSRAPARFFAAGLGDALSKKDEVAQCEQAGGHNFFATAPLTTAGLLARHCYSTILEHGPAALKQINDHHTPDDNVERAVEATVLWSGLAFESGGLSIAHALTRGFSAQASMAGYLHGEMVAFGSIVQMYAQHEPQENIHRHAEFVSSLGLPVRFSDFQGFTPTQEEILDIAALTCQAPYIGNITPAADQASIAAALMATDALGRRLAISCPALD